MTVDALFKNCMVENVNESRHSIKKNKNVT